MRGERCVVRNIGDLPSWFDLSKYAEADSLDAAGWYTQLKLRQDALCCLDFDESRVFPNTLEVIEDIRQQCTEGFKVITNLLRVCPIAPASCIKTTPWGEGFFGPTFSAAVRSMTVGDLRIAERMLSVGRLKYSRNWIDSIDGAFNGRGGVVFRGKSWINRPLYESRKCDLLSCAEETKQQRLPWGSTPVVIDLAMPDAMLIEQFREWLSNTRNLTQTIESDRRFRRPDFDAWIKYGVLPYLDLVIWATETGRTIPNRVMADAIFQPWEGDSEAVRKTVAPLAISLVSESINGGASVMSILAAQAGIDHG